MPWKISAIDCFAVESGSHFAWTSPTQNEIVPQLLGPVSLRPRKMTMNLQLRGSTLVAAATTLGIAFAATALAQRPANPAFDTESTIVGKAVDLPRPEARPQTPAASVPVAPVAFDTPALLAGRPVDARTAYRHKAGSPATADGAAALESRRVETGPHVRSAWPFDTEETIIGNHRARNAF